MVDQARRWTFTPEVGSGPGPLPWGVRAALPKPRTSLLRGPAQTFSMSSPESLHITSPLTSSVLETKCTQPASIDRLLCALQGAGPHIYRAVIRYNASHSASVAALHAQSPIPWLSLHPFNM